MKSILAHLGIVALFLLWLHFNQKPVASDLSSSQLEITTQAITQTTCVSPQRIDPYEIREWIRTHPNCTFQSVLFLLNAESEFLGKAINEQLKAEILNLDFGPSVLEVSSGSGGATEFFFFDYADRERANWRFLGAVEPNASFFSYHIVRGEKQSWFVLRERWGHGSGVGAYGETWYEVNKSSVTSVLGFPVNGADVGTRELKSRLFKGVVVSYEIINGRTTIKVKFQVDYIFPDDDSQAFLSKHQEAIYIRNDRTGEFKLDEQRSTITNEELGDVYFFDSLDDPKFLKYNFAELTQIASYGSKQQKKALKKYLLDLPKSKRAQSLLARLH